MATLFKIILSSSLLVLAFFSCGESNELSKKKMTNKDYFDNKGQVFIKLYKKEADSSFLYWEAWNVDEKTATTHWGLLGTLGDHRDIKESSHQALKTRINFLIAEKLSQGYSEIPVDKLFTVSVTFKLKTWGTPEDLDRREQIRDILTEHLGWTGNGRCDDGDIGSGEMTLFADVVDPFIAIKTIPKEFEKRQVTEEYIFTISQGDSIIVENLKPDL